MLLNFPFWKAVHLTVSGFSSLLLLCYFCAEVIFNSKQDQYFRFRKVISMVRWSTGLGCSWDIGIANIFTTKKAIIIKLVRRVFLCGADLLDTNSYGWCWWHYRSKITLPWKQRWNNKRDCLLGKSWPLKAQIVLRFQTDTTGSDMFPYKEDCVHQIWTLGTLLGVQQVAVSLTR